jgi:hypothetical protein
MSYWLNRLRQNAEYYKPVMGAPDDSPLGNKLAHTRAKLRTISELVEDADDSLGYGTMHHLRQVLEARL